MPMHDVIGAKLLQGE